MAKRNSRRKVRTRQQRKQVLRVEALERKEMLTTFYVDGTGGDDSADGQSLATPFATIQAAASIAQPGDAVLIRGGVYREEVDVPRSGGATAPIVFSAYQNEEVIVSGGDLVTGWTPAPSVGPNVWQATVGWNAGGNRDGNTLFVNGEYQAEARQFGENDLLDIDDWGLLRQGRLVNNANSFVVDDLGAFPNDYWNGAKINFHTFDYIITTRTITDFDSSTGRITYDSPVGTVSQKQNNGYYIYDTINALDKPGEWFKAAGSNTLYYQAEAGQDPNDLEIEFKRRGFGFDVASRDNIHITGITFRGTSINAGGNADNNLYQDNRFYAYDKAGIGRFNLTGDNNVVRDNEFSQTWSSALVIGGDRNEVVNNYLHDIGYSATARAITASSANELLFSHNTLRKYARSAMDGYPTRSEIAYNVFEDGGRLTWDTGVFDSDGTNGNSSYSIFHHNVFRNNTEARGIFEAFYGRNDNAVIHHNLFYNFEDDFRPVLRASGTEFRQVFHNTIITSASTAPEGTLQARDAIGTRYNNNIQITADRMEALGIDARGNHDYSPADFINFAGNDYRLAPGSDAIDTGIVIPGINDDFLGDAPDAGAFESGRPAWEAGHDFASPPNPVYSWFAVPGTNLYDNGQFLEGIGDWTVVSGSPNAQDRNSWNLAPSGAPLTGTFRTRSIEFTPGESLSRTFTGLTPNTTYTLGATARLADRIAAGNTFNGSSGSIGSGVHRLEGYVTGLTAGEWVRYDNIDFGDPGQYDLLDVLHIRDPATLAGSIDGVSIEVRVDSPTGQLIAEFSDLADGITTDRWRADRSDLSAVSGNRSIYVSVSGANAANLAVGSFRLLNSAAAPDDQLVVEVQSAGAETRFARIGTEDWERGYDEIVFTTGPSATTATVRFTNAGRLNAYVDRVYLAAGEGTRGGEPRDLSTGAQAYRSTGPNTRTLSLELTDGSAATEALAGDHPGNWVQVDLEETQAIQRIELVPPASLPARLSNFRVTVWSADPDSGGTLLWSQDYLTGGQSLGAGDVLQIQADAHGSDGTTTLNQAHGRFVRVESLGTNTAGDERLGLAEVRVSGFDLNNLAISDSSVSQSTTAGGSASFAVDNDPTTYTETNAAATNSWWQTRFSQPFSIGRIELQNRDDALFSDLSNFRVSVWDEDPATGGTKLWEKSYFGSGSVGQGETFLIDGSEVSDTSTRRLASVHTGRVVRVELIGTNNNGNGRLSLAGVRVASADTAPPIANVAQRGTASQSANFYGDRADRGFASDANNGLVSPVSNFTSALAEPGVWWQVELENDEALEQIVVYNRTDAASRLNNFRVSVWDGDPDAGGSELWGRTNFYSGSAATYSTGNTIGPGGALIIDGGDTSGGVRLDSTTGARYVRVQLLGSNILSLPEVQVWTGSNTIDLAAGATDFDFDFGTTESPSLGGWERVTPTTYGDVRWSRAIDADSRVGGGFNVVNQDYVTSDEAATLDIEVPNGVYTAVINLGDAQAARDSISIWAEGQLIAEDIGSAAGQIVYVDESGASTVPTGFEVIVRDGQFNLKLDDTGDGPTAEPGWVLNRLSLERIADVPAGPDNALQLIVSPGGEGLLRNETGETLSLEGYSITSGQSLLSPSQWVGLGTQQYDNTNWSETNATSSVLAESGAAIEIPNGGQVYVGKIFDGPLDPSLSLQFQLQGGSPADGFVALGEVAVPGLVGDFNGDFRVDAADYTVWLDGLGTQVTPFSASDANGDGHIDRSDWRFWQTRYGDQVVVSDLINATTGNGSFESWGDSDALTRVLVNNNSATIPGWTTVTTGGNGGWLRQGDGAATAGASSDGIAYAIAAAGATAEMTSDPLGHTTAEGDRFIVSLDVGSKDGADNTYEVSLVFGGQEQVLGTIIDGPNASTEGLNTHQIEYVAVAADSGLVPSLRITSTANGFSQAFVDNVILKVTGGGAAASSIALSTTATPTTSASTTEETIELATQAQNGFIPALTSTPISLAPSAAGTQAVEPVADSPTLLALLLDDQPADAPSGGDETIESAYPGEEGERDFMSTDEAFGDSDLWAL